MKDILSDIISHIDGLKGINTVKVTGTEKETKIFTKDDSRTVVINGVFTNPHPEFMGVFGIPNLSKLKTILSFDEYDSESLFEVRKSKFDDEGEIPTSFHFETKSKDFINDFRLMSKATVESQLQELTFKLKDWDFTFEPKVASIQRLKRQAQANSDESTFRMTTDNGNLKVMFGDASTSSGNFIFEQGITAKVTDSWHWPVEQVNFILGLVGDKKMSISSKGAMQISVDSGLVKYDFIILGSTK